MILWSKTMDKKTNFLIKKGELLPDFILPTMGGGIIHLKNYKGKKVLLFCWASWCTSREYLPVLQTFYEKHRNKNFEVISIALDVQGVAFPMKYIKKYNVTFTTLIDNQNVLSRLLGLKELPNSLLLDEDGYVMLVGKDPSHDFLADVEYEFGRRVDKHLRTEYLIEHKHSELEILMQSCTNFLGRGRKEDALKSLKKALELETDNLIIRKQIWAIENPEKFYSGNIDLSWQEKQLTS